MTQDLKADDGQPPRKQHPARLRPAPLHVVQIQRHALPPRWIIPQSDGTYPAVDRLHAREEGVRAAHRRAGVPPWLPCVRHSLQFTTAQPVIADDPQGSIFDRQVAA
jgi:hypothetical protein